MLLLLC